MGTHMAAGPGRWRRAARGLALGLAAALGLALLLRRELAGLLLRRALVARGVPVESLRVTALGPRQIRIGSLRLLHGIVSGGEIVADFDLAGLRAKRLAAVEVRGLRIAWTGSEDPIDFQALLRHAPQDLAQAAAAIRALGALRLSDTRIEVLTRSVFGRLESRIDGTIEARSANGFAVDLASGVATPIGRLDGRLRAGFSPGEGLAGVWEVGSASYRGRAGEAQAGLGRVRIELSPAGVLRAQGALTLGAAVLPAEGLHLAGGGLAIDLLDDRLELAFEGRMAGADLALGLQLSAHSLFSIPEVDLEVDASGRGAAALACLGLDARDASELEARLRLGGTLGERGAQSPRAYVVQRLSPQVSLRARGLRLGGRADGVDVELAARLASEGEEVQLRLDRDARIAIERLDLPAGAAAPRLPLELRLPAAGANRFAIVPAPLGYRISGPLAVEVSEGPGRHRLEARIEAVVGRDLVLRGLSAADLVLALRDASVQGRVLPRLEARGDLQLDAGPARGRLNLVIAAQALDGLELAPIALEARGRIAATGQVSGRIEARVDAARLPSAGLAARGLVLALERTGPSRRWSGALDVGRVALEGEAPLLAPFALELRLTGPGPGSRRILAGGRATIAGLPGIALAGWLEPEGRARFDLDSGWLDFRPGTLEPRHLLPRLEELRVQRGAARVSATVRLASGRAQGEGRLQLLGLDAQLGPLGLLGLDLDLALDSLDPPASAAFQQLHVRAVESALGRVASGVELCFEVLPGAPPRLRVERLAAEVPGGRVSARDLLLDPGAEENVARLQVDRLDLGELFRRLEVEGLEGEGSVAGQVPVRLDGEGLSIAGARLDSLAPGVLRYRSERVRELLAGNGQWVDLMVEALRDFRYELLEARVPAASGREVKLALKLRGHNPNVLEGHPLIVNVEVEGRLHSLLAALSEGYRLQRELLWRSLRGRR